MTRTMGDSVNVAAIPSTVAVAAFYLSNMEAVEAACKAGGWTLGTHYKFWLATLDGTQLAPPGVVACQFGAHGTWDESVVYDDSIWLPVAPPPAKPSPPTLQDVYEVAIKTLDQVSALAAEVRGLGR